MTAIDKYLEQINFPETLSNSFLSEIESVGFDDPRQTTEVCENYFSQYDFSWPEGVEFLKAEGKRGTFKQQCSLFANRLSRLSRQLSQFERVKRATKPISYITVSKGPKLSECCIHSGLYDKIIYFNPAFFEKYPFSENIECFCSWRQVSDIEFKKKGFSLDESVISKWEPKKSISLEQIEKGSEKIGAILKSALIIAILIPVAWICFKYALS